ncbi:hypothetical protein [Streptomyces sp. NPDC102437]|uniref:hypothetical protein n=1 Tax=Streptomyces sp. NPDC102437 TaxID=3366175 RepID=UPI00380161BF
MMARHDDWCRIYDSAPVTDIDTTTAYLKETSTDGGATWEYPRDSTGEHLRLDMTEALIADLTIGLREGVVVIQSPHPAGGLIRYTPIR